MTTEQENQLLTDVAAIKRGVYGDEKNEQPGLLHRVSMLEKWQSGIKAKVLMVSGGLVVACFILKEALQGLWAWVSGKAHLWLFAISLAVLCSGCAAYNKTGWWTPDGMSYTYATPFAHTSVAPPTHYFGLSWSLKDK